MGRPADNGSTGFQLDSSWPGLDSGKKLEIEKDEVKKILKILRDDYESYNSGSGTLNELQSKGNITTAQLGNYPAAMSLQASTQKAYLQLNQTYNAFLSSYEAVINALEKAVGNYEDMEHNNTAAANGVDSPATNTGSKPTTKNTSAY